MPALLLQRMLVDAVEVHCGLLLRQAAGQKRDPWNCRWYTPASISRYAESDGQSMPSVGRFPLPAQHNSHNCHRMQCRTHMARTTQKSLQICHFSGLEQDCNTLNTRKGKAIRHCKASGICMQDLFRRGFAAVITAGHDHVMNELQV